MRQKSIVYFLISFSAGVVVWLSFSFGLFWGFENFAEDLLFSRKPINGKLAIVAIDDESINHIGQWPWPREVFAKVLLKLNENPPLAVGFDVMLSEPSRQGQDDDKILKDALAKLSYPVIMPVEALPLILEKDKTPLALNFLKPLEIFRNQNSVSLGMVNLISDSDSVVRRFPLFVSDREKKEKFSAFSYEIAKKSGLEIPNERTLQNINPVRSPISEIFADAVGRRISNGINRIVYSAPAGSVRKAPLLRLLEKEPGLDFQDKIIFIGATAPDLQDQKSTPFSKGVEMPGVEIQANIANMLLSGYRLSALSDSFTFIWILLAALFPSVLFLSRAFLRGIKPRRKDSNNTRSSPQQAAEYFGKVRDLFLERDGTALFGNMLAGAGHLLAAVILFQNGIAANLIHINFAWILSLASLFSYRFFSVKKEKREIKNLFSKYVSRDVLAEILRNPGKVSLGGEEKEITILFCDIRGFTALSEQTTPRELVSLLNRYFSAMTEKILEKGGVLDKYIGDAIMAFWGAPIENENQADGAFEAALGMLENLEELNKELKSTGKPEIRIGIGIYTGRAVVGNVGSHLRFDYTAIGDSVNTASRLEGLTKEYKTNIIIGESVKNKLKKNYNLKFLDSVIVKGKLKPVNIYGLE